jgi:hypothetical protein
VGEALPLMLIFLETTSNDESDSDEAANGGGFVLVVIELLTRQRTEVEFNNST